MLAKAIIDVTFFFFIQKGLDSGVFFILFCGRVIGFQLNYILSVASNDIFFHPCHGNTFIKQNVILNQGFWWA
jgi:hypothetical protein